MGVLDSPVDLGVGLTVGKAQGPVDHTGFFENIGAGYRQAQAGPGSTRSRQNAAEAPYYDEIVKALSAEGEMGEDQLQVRPGGIGYRGPKDIPVNQFGIGVVPIKRPFRNPYTGTPSLSQDDNPLARLYLGGDRKEIDSIWGAIQRVRQRKPDFLPQFKTEADIAKFAQADRNRRLAEAEQTTSRAGTLGKVGAFVGNLAGSIVAGDPENFVGAGVGGAGGKTIARTIIKRGITEGAINAAAGATALPGQAEDTERLGGEMTSGDAVRSIAEQGAIGFLFGAGGASVPLVIGKGKDLAGKAAEGAVTAASRVPAVRDAIAAASLRAGTVKDRALLTEYRRMHSPYAAVGDTSTPDERAAINVAERDIEVREASPLPNDASGHHENRLDAVARSLGMDLPAPELPSTAPVQQPTVERRAAGYEEAVHQAEGTGKNPDSSASGHFQFTEGTWLEYAPRVVDTKGKSKAQILAMRNDRDIATRAERLFRQDNGRYLRDHGVEDSPGNLSLAHFLGKSDAAKVLRAAPDTPVSQLVDAGSIRSNRNVFKNIRTAADMTAWAHRRIGAVVNDTPARADSPLEEEEIAYEDIHPFERFTFRPDEVETDAALMQYKSGGDEAGVTDKLKAVTSWNPTLSSEIMVWESADGRRVVVDGHQRTGLAKRLFADDPSIQLPAIIFREADGITAQQARVIGALRNIALGTGSLIDNARVLRDAPNGSRMIQGAEHRREIEGLAKLSYDAFGAAVNDVIDPRIAAQIGLNAGDKPETHLAMVDLMLRERIHSPKEAAAIVRQAGADGFGTPEAEQMGLFGDVPTQSLYVPIARILESASKRLREEKRTFKTLSRKASKIEEAGNVLDRAANEERVIGSDEALAILNATAHRSGPVRDALIAAARAELSGARRADAVEQFLGELGDIDLQSAARGVGQSGRDGANAGDAGSPDALEAEDGDVPDASEPSLFDQAVSSAARAEVFSDPVGPAAREQTALIEHDLLVEQGLDPAIAERQQQETTLKAASPMRSVEEQDGTMGLGLFDVADQPTFRLDEEGDARPLNDIMGEADLDEIAAQAAKECLK